MTKLNKKTIYFPPGREDALRRIAIRENLRGPNGEYSISAAIGWLIGQDEERMDRPAQPKAPVATTRTAPKTSADPRYVKDEE